MIRNKRADISITILVIGVFVICALTIVSFVVSIGSTKANFVNTEVIENLSSSLSDFYFYVNSGMSEQQAASNIGAQINGNQLILNAQQAGVLSVTYTVDLSN